MADKDSKVYYWLKKDKDYYNKYKIKSLIAETKGDTYLVILEQLQHEALNQVENGVGRLRYSLNRAYTIKELASVIGRTPKLLTEALNVLEDKELIKVEDDGTILVFDITVGKETGQTRRKNNSKVGNDVVNFTEDLPQDYQKNEVENTLEIRDKRLEIEEDITNNAHAYKNLSKDIENINSRFREMGIDEDTIKKAENIFYSYTIQTSGFYQRIMNVLTDDSIYNKEGYIYEIALNYQ